MHISILICCAPDGPVHLTLQLKFLVSDLQDHPPINIADSGWYIGLSLLISAVCFLLQLKFLVSDLRDRLPINIADIRHYMTAPGGFHTHCLQRTESG
jgi:uncharacterized protein YneF (UPF0154 family)